MLIAELEAVTLVVDISPDVKGCLLKVIKGWFTQKCNSTHHYVMNDFIFCGTQKIFQQFFPPLYNESQWVPYNLSQWTGNNFHSGDKNTVLQESPQLFGCQHKSWRTSLQFMFFYVRYHSSAASQITMTQTTQTVLTFDYLLNLEIEHLDNVNIIAGENWRRSVYADDNVKQ